MRKTGELMPDSFVKSMNETKIALKGPTTTPAGGQIDKRPDETAIQAFANVRPIKTIPGLKQIRNVDLIIVRENSEDLYKGIEYMDDDTSTEY